MLRQRRASRSGQRRRGQARDRTDPGLQPGALKKKKKREGGGGGGGGRKSISPCALSQGDAIRGSQCGRWRGPRPTGPPASRLMARRRDAAERFARGEPVVWSETGAGGRASPPRRRFRPRPGRRSDLKRRRGPLLDALAQRRPLRGPSHGDPERSGVEARRGPTRAHGRAGRGRWRRARARCLWSRPSAPVKRRSSPRRPAEHCRHRVGECPKLRVAVDALYRLGVHAERDVVHEHATVDLGKIHHPLATLGERVERSHHVVAINAEIEREMVTGPAGTHTYGSRRSAAIAATIACVPSPPATPSASAPFAIASRTASRDRPRAAVRSARPPGAGLTRDVETLRLAATGLRVIEQHRPVRWRPPAAAVHGERPAAAATESTNPAKTSASSSSRPSSTTSTTAPTSNTPASSGTRDAREAAAYQRPPRGRHRNQHAGKDRQATRKSLHAHDHRQHDHRREQDNRHDRCQPPIQHHTPPLQTAPRQSTDHPQPRDGDPNSHQTICPTALSSPKSDEGARPIPRPRPSGA